MQIFINTEEVEVIYVKNEADRIMEDSIDKVLDIYNLEDDEQIDDYIEEEAISMIEDFVEDITESIKSDLIDNFEELMKKNYGKKLTKRKLKNMEKINNF